MKVVIIYFCKVPLIVKNHSTDYTCVHVGSISLLCRGLANHSTSRMLHKSILEKKRTVSPNKYTERGCCARKDTQDMFISICLFKQEALVFYFTSARAMPEQGFVWALKNKHLGWEKNPKREGNQHIREMEAQQPTCTVAFRKIP